MSVQDEPVPPVPEHTPPKKEDEGTPNAGKYFSHTWTRWFVSLREKVNVINDTVASLSRLVGNGFVTVDGGTAVSRSIVGTDDRVSVANGNGVAGNPTIDVVTADLIAGPNVSFTGSGTGRIIDNGDGDLTISATGGGGGGIAPVVTESGTSLTATPANSGNYTRFTSSSAKAYTFDDAENYVVGAEYHGRNVGAGGLTITEAGAMTVNPPTGGTLVIPQGGTFTVKIVAADEADLFGVTVDAS